MLCSRWRHVSQHEHMYTMNHWNLGIDLSVCANISASSVSSLHGLLISDKWKLMFRLLLPPAASSAGWFPKVDVDQGHAGVCRAPGMHLRPEPVRCWGARRWHTPSILVSKIASIQSRTSLLEFARSSYFSLVHLGLSDALCEGCTTGCFIRVLSLRLADSSFRSLSKNSEVVRSGTRSQRQVQASFEFQNTDS